MITRMCCYIMYINLLVLVNSGIYTKEIGKEEIDDNPQYTDSFQAIKPSTDEQIFKQDKHFWLHQGTSYLKKSLLSENVVIPTVAKNVIFFLADGMGATTTTAARIYKGQRLGKIGEEHVLSFEEFQNVALVKTYDVDMQVPDSASTATALFTGVKTRYKTIGLDSTNKLSEFNKETYDSNKLNSFMVWAQQSGKATGIVTTTRITHATPAATYARIPHRDWECDSFIPAKYKDDLKDIARQLVEDSPGKNFNVILGGGQEQMGYINMNEKSVCPREDNLNLTERWLKNQDETAAFVVDKNQLNEVNDDTDYLLGLFSPSHLPYELNRQKTFQKFLV